MLEVWRKKKLGQVSVRTSDGIMTRAGSQQATADLTAEDVLQALDTSEEVFLSHKHLFLPVVDNS